MAETKTAQELALDMPDVIYAGRVYGQSWSENENKFEHTKLVKYTRTLTPPSDDAVSEALDNVSWLRNNAEPKTSYYGLDFAIKLNAIEQALQSRAGQEGEYPRYEIYHNNDGEFGRYCGWMLKTIHEHDSYSHPLEESKIYKSLKEPHPSGSTQVQTGTNCTCNPTRADAVDVEAVREFVIKQLSNEIVLSDDQKDCVETGVNRACYFLQGKNLTQKPDDGMVLVPREPNT